MTIPPNLAAFRALMRLAEQCATELHERHHSAECTGCELHATATMCDALATATPAQLCGIVEQDVEQIRRDAFDEGYAQALQEQS